MDCVFIRPIITCAVMTGYCITFLALPLLVVGIGMTHILAMILDSMKRPNPFEQETLRNYLGRIVKLACNCIYRACQQFKSAAKTSPYVSDRHEISSTAVTPHHIGTFDISQLHMHYNQLLNQSTLGSESH